MASSTTTSLEPRRRQIVPAEPRLPSARPSRIAGDDEAQRGSDRKQHRREHAQGRGEGKHPGAQAETVEEGHGVEHAGRNEADEEPHSPLSDREPQGAPDQGQDDTFRHELGQETRGGRTHRTSHGDLTLPTLGPHQEQAHDVDARNHEQQSRSPEEDQEGGPDVADDHVGEGRDGRALPAIRIGILGLESCGNGFQVGLSGLDGLAVLEPAHAVEPVAATPKVAVARWVKRWSRTRSAPPARNGTREAGPR